MLKTFINTDLFSDIKRVTKLLFLTLIPKIFGLLKEILIARSYGVSADIDDYILIVAFITFPLSFYISGTQTFLVKLMKKSEEISSRNIIESYLYINIVFSIVCIPTLFYFGLKSLGLSNSITVYNLIILCGYYLVTSTNVLLYGYLQVKNMLNRNFLIPMLSPIGFVLIITICAPGFDTLILALFISVLLEFLVLTKLISNKVNLTFYDWHYFKTFQENFPDWIGFCIVSFIPSFIPLILQLVYRGYGDGVISLISYSSRLPLAFTGLLLTVISVYTFTYMEGLTKRKLTNIKRKIFEFQVLIILLTLPITVVIILFSRDIVYVIYASDNISMEEISKIYRYQLIFLINTPLLVLNMFLWRSIVFLDVTKKLVLISSVSGIANVCFLLTTSLLSPNLEYLIVASTVGLGLFNFVLYQIFLNKSINGHSNSINASI